MTRAHRTQPPSQCMHPPIPSKNQLNDRASTWSSACSSPKTSSLERNRVWKRTAGPRPSTGSLADSCLEPGGNLEVNRHRRWAGGFGCFVFSGHRDGENLREAEGMEEEEKRGACQRGSSE
jgi:hypothetical protein